MAGDPLRRRGPGMTGGGEGGSRRPGDRADPRPAPPDGQSGCKAVPAPDARSPASMASAIPAEPPADFPPSPSGHPARHPSPGIIRAMVDRGLPIVDGAPACPFVAFEDDRDARATAPDHRHRCYAEPRPAPRALAHQEAYCLSSAFPVCPTFQDGARREAAAARPAAARADAATPD